jgi:hypothetical protein
MLSDTLFDLKESLDHKLYHYTSGTFNKTYEADVIIELQDIINRIDRLRKKLDDPDFKGDYRFEPQKK